MLSCWASVQPTAHSLQPTDQVGVLVLAHGGSSQWNAQVEAAVAQAGLSEPTEIAFGMGMHPTEVQAVQHAIESLEARGVHRIVAIPLLISSHSEVMRQYEYLLGLREEGSWEEQVQPVAVHVPVTMTAALDDDPIVAEVLLERARTLSRVPHEEAVILVAHGPYAEEDNDLWLETMGKLAAWVQEQGHFRAVVPVTLRDDAPRHVQAQATRQLRAVVQEQSRYGRALVVPLLLATGGIEQKIPKRLRGLTYDFQGQTLLPHPKLARWIADRVQTAASTQEPLVI